MNNLDDKKQLNVMFVCTGNACRSVMAEALFKKTLAEKSTQRINVKSRGTAASKTYRVPPIVLSLMSEKDIDLKGHKSTQLTKTCVETSDLILVMDEHHKQYISKHFPESLGKVFLIKDYAEVKSKHREIFDPIGQPDEVYFKAMKEIELCVKNISKKMEKENDELHS